MGVHRDQLDFAGHLFDDVARETARPDGAPGVDRVAYSPGESRALYLVACAAERLGLMPACDRWGNLLVRPSGIDWRHDAPGDPPWVLCGSHLDAVPAGGNYDGLAGVVTGLFAVQAAAAANARRGLPPPRVALAALRAEESGRFGLPYIGARGLLGMLDTTVLQRSDADGIRVVDALFDALNPPREMNSPRTGSEFARAAPLPPARIGAYLELHIEQGPVLEQDEEPLAVVVGLAGCARARVLFEGAPAHSGAAPWRGRRDAVFAFADFARHVEREADEADFQARGLVATLGVVGTDPRVHGPTRVPERLTASFELRCEDGAWLAAAWERARDQLATYTTERRVVATLTDERVSPPVELPEWPRALLRRHAARALEAATAEPDGTPALDPARVRSMWSGAGHDVAVFAQAGVPAGLLFVRNQHGSHCAAESMRMDDWALGTDALAGALAEAAGMFADGGVPA
jgi:N-carbamoyl-L-amino-acid hydrolase